MADTATPESREERAYKAKLKREESRYKAWFERDDSAHKAKRARRAAGYGHRLYPGGLNYCLLPPPEVKFVEVVPKTGGFQELTENMGIERAKNYSWRMISLIEQKEESKGNENFVAAIKENRAKVESKLITVSKNDVLDLLETYLISTSTTGETKVFYLRLVGDYYRYVAASKTGAKRKEASKSALLAYKSAQDTALTKLAPTHPTRLGLALNFSIFYHEILRCPNKACYVAKQAVDKAVKELKTDEVEPHEDTALLIEALRDNLCLWRSDMQGKLRDILCLWRSDMQERSRGLWEWSLH